jgi:hypothetical protein
MSDFRGSEMQALEAKDRLAAKNVEIERLRVRVAKLEDCNAALEGTCRSARLCMSCLYGAPDPIGCTDCLGTGWDGGDPHSQIEVLEARVAKLEAALELVENAQDSLRLHGWGKDVDAVLAAFKKDPKGTP